MMVTLSCLGLLWTASTDHARADDLFFTNQAGHLWDLDIDEYFLDDGTDDTYDDVGFIGIDDGNTVTWFDHDADKAAPIVDRMHGLIRSASVPLGTDGVLSVRQVWWFPFDELFARQTVVFENTSGKPYTATVMWNGNLGSDDDTTIIATESGDAEVDSTDAWSLSWDGRGSDPYAGFVWGDGVPLANDPGFGEFEDKYKAKKEKKLQNSDDVELEFEITFPPGQPVALSFLYVQSWSASDAQDAIDAMGHDAWGRHLTGDELRATASVDLSAFDPDEDGATSPLVGGDDCDDRDPTVYPDAPEVCDGIDQDCDGSIDEGTQEAFYPDYDQDGYGDDLGMVMACASPELHVAVGGDCDDSDDDTFEGSEEQCGDGEDNDCNGTVDDEDRCAPTAPPVTERMACTTAGFGPLGPLLWWLGGLALVRRTRSARFPPTAR